MIFLTFYFSFASGFYIGMSLKDPSGFINSDFGALFRGFLLAFLFWPIGLIAKLIMILNPKAKGE